MGDEENVYVGYVHVEGTKGEVPFAFRARSFKEGNQRESPRWSDLLVSIRREPWICPIVCLDGLQWLHSAIF